jgi:hypothetical protein
MALVVKDRVQETCTSPGTGTVTLLGAVSGFQTFSAAIGNANTTYYTIADQAGVNWEVGLGTYSTTGNTLTRTTVLASSNAGSLVNFSTGSQFVWGDYPAGKAVYIDGSGVVNIDTINLTNALIPADGGTGVLGTITGITYANGTSAYTAATSAQVVSLIGTTFVANATFATSSGSVTNSHTAGSGLSGTTFNGSAAVTWTLATAYGDTINPYASKTANYFLAAPNGTAGVPTFRAIIAADIPTLNQSTTGSAGSVSNSVTFNNGGSGAASGSTYNGSAAVTISYNTIGAYAATNPSGYTSNTLSAGTGISVSASTGASTITNTAPNIIWQSVQTTAFTAVAGNGYPVNTTSGAITVTLPASPTAGQMICILDYAGTSATNNITINPNGLKIQGGTSNRVININREAITLAYIDATQGWLAISDVYATTAPLPSAPYTISYLVVAGGGAGGWNGGGGGGAGGYLTSTATVTAGTVYTATVGGGGSGNSSGTSAGGNGSNSSLTGGALSVTSIGGGGGAGGSVASGVAGGSGGGGNGNNTANSPGGAGTAGQGNAGGTGVSGNGPGGGGGGASAAGTNGSSGGTGGNGTASSITGSSVTYAGGGGAARNTGTPVAGGTGGGGTGGTSSVAATAGTTNLGGGSGGAWNAGGSAPNGGSGVVIISVPTANYTGTVTGSPTVTTSGANTIITWTSSSGTYTA